MNEFIFCKEAMKTERLQEHFDLNGEDIVGDTCFNPSMLKAYTPYRVGLK